MNCEISPRTKSGINELSPRKFPRSPILSPRKTLKSPVVPPKTPPQWKKPEDVMRSHRLRIRRNALDARMKANVLFQRNEDSSEKSLPRLGGKRSNPFKCASEASDIPKKKVKELSDESKSDDSLFQLLGLNNSQHSDQSFLQFTAHLESHSEISKHEKRDTTKLLAALPVDWTLRHKMRFVSSLPIPWNKTLKTCEEASGITGFVRCIEEEPNSSCNGLNSSPNVEFHQCCLYWQHPNLPWLQLFPRTHLRRGDLNKIPPITMYPSIKDSLHRDWSESFRSLFQLVRARHCPYFYLVANSFNCLFRAAGLNGFMETNAIISPTTRGFRKLLMNEGIEFSMPLKVKHKRASQDFENENDELEEEVEEESAGEAKEWLASLGVGEEEIKKISDSEVSSEFDLEKKIDGNDESLLYVEGCEINALFNFLINCRTITVTTGPLAGIPPTLLSPVAFYGGTLASLKVRDTIVKVDNENFFSLEVKGPILPHTIHNLCNVLKGSIDRFSITCANIEYSKAFTSATKLIIDEQTSESNKKDTSGKAFSVENLSDCGLKSQLLQTFCSRGIQQFDSIKYSENSYVCS